MSRTAIRTAAAYSGSVLATLAAAALAACPANLAEGSEAPASATQLVTVEAKVARTTYASLRTWRRVDGCWVAAGGPYAARLGRNGLSANRREGDGTTPTGTFRIGRTMYGHAPNPGVRFAYRRLRCGDWWNENPRSPTYNSFQHVACGAKPPFAGASEGMWQRPRHYPFLAVVEYNMRARSYRAVAPGSSCTPGRVGRRSAASASGATSSLRCCGGSGRPRSP